MCSTCTKYKRKHRRAKRRKKTWVKEEAERSQQKQSMDDRPKWTPIGWLHTVWDFLPGFI